MTQVRLPALDGYSPLGIMAAIGCLRLLTEFGATPARLSWSEDDLVGILHSELGDVDMIVERLASIVAGIGEGSVLPGLPSGFPPPGAAPDRLRLPRRTYASDAAHLLNTMAVREQAEAESWLASLVTDLGADDQGRVSISQFTAPSGKQSMSTMLAKPLELIREESSYLREALEGWRRVADVTGEYLDHRAMWDGTQAGDGTGRMRGVPGATWLALMSFPLIRTTWSARNRPTSSGWHTVVEGRRRYDELRLPVWTMPLSPPGVVALVEHPALGRNPLATQQLRRLGVVQVCRARRRQPPGAKSAGVLTTVR